MRAFISAFLFLFLLSAVQAEAQTGYTKRQQPQAQAGKRAANLNKNYKFSLYGGVFQPSGSFEPAGYPEFSYETGFGGGADITYFLSNNFGLGIFFDFNTFPSEERVISGVKFKFKAMSYIVGVSGTGRLNLTDNIDILATARIGGSFNSLEVDASHGWNALSKQTSGSAFAASIEGGAVYLINSYNLGFILKYSMIEQDVKDEDSTNLGGVSILLTVGYSF
jgi:hypothetical protein